MIARVDTFLNSITMYSLVLRSLFVLAGFAIVLAFFGVLPHGGFAYVFLFLILTVTCYSSNALFAKIFNVPANIESSSITALILFFLMFPVVSGPDAITAFAVGFLAIASKYLIAINKRHIFNPVAAGAFIVGLLPFLENGNVVWWVGTPGMLPLVLIIGLLIVRKIRKFAMFFAFVIAALVTTVAIDPSNALEMLKQNILSWPLIFFGAFMLTEPITMPPHRKIQIIFGLIVGVLFIARFHIGPIYSTPELALLIGNLFAYVFSLKRRLMLTLREKHLVSKDTYEFSFASDAPFSFHPGQYLEWTIPTSDKSDARGNRRYFTIASSPTEKEVKLGVKFYEPSSSFKTDLRNLKEGYVIAAGQCGGDFIMPKDLSKRLVFIAGGIGVTPFRSMIKSMIDKGEKRDVTLIYSVKTEDEIAYKDIFEQAKEVGVKTNYMVGNFLTKEIIEKDIPDWKERMFYLSGPNVMVENYKNLLTGMGVKRSVIVTDYFPGF